MTVEPGSSSLIDIVISAKVVAAKSAMCLELCAERAQHLPASISQSEANSAAA
jgi:hypothetical protein